MTIKVYNTDVSFWELYPATAKMSAFKKMYRKDTARGKPYASKKMWAFAMYVDMSKSNNLHNLPKKEREEIINEDYLGGSAKLDPEGNKEAIEMMAKLLMPRKKAVLKNYLDKLDERAALLEATKYTLENAAELDKLIGNTDKLYDVIAKIETSIENDEGSGMVKGGRTESISELGEI